MSGKDRRSFEPTQTTEVCARLPVVDQLGCAAHLAEFALLRCREPNLILPRAACIVAETSAEIGLVFVFEGADILFV
jgi:hypothetical protein